MFASGTGTMRFPSRTKTLDSGIGKPRPRVWLPRSPSSARRECRRDGATGTYSPSCSSMQPVKDCCALKADLFVLGTLARLAGGLRRQAETNSQRYDLELHLRSYFAVVPAGKTTVMCLQELFRTSVPLGLRRTRQESRSRPRPPESTSDAGDQTSASR